MWLNEEQIVDAAVRSYRRSFRCSGPQLVVVDHLFDPVKLDQVIDILKHSNNWTTQTHTYAALHVGPEQWQASSKKDRFVKRDIWQKDDPVANEGLNCLARDFLLFLRSQDFMSLLSRICNVTLTDQNVMSPTINTNYFRLGAPDFVKQHADDSPGRALCMLLYLNKEWQDMQGGELIFSGKDDKEIVICPVFNRCVLFDPSSEGSEHRVNALSDIDKTNKCISHYRYNITSWYWSQ